MHAVTDAVREPARRATRRLTGIAGGQRRARAVVLLALVLGLDSADLAMIGAIAGKLEPALRLSNTKLGLLAAVPSLFGALATVPIGVLTDRVRRVPMITGSVVIWSVAMAASGVVSSFVILLLIRLALGAASGTAGPTVSSLVGDYFTPNVRGRVYGLILTGELVGAGVGYVGSGEISSLLGWRSAFFLLAIPSLVLAVVLWRYLPEPARGAQGRSSDDGQPAQKTFAQRHAHRRHVMPHERLILRRDPLRMTLRQATRYVLGIRTNLVLIVASALGYFYFTGLQTFGPVFFGGRYGLSQSAATALLGILGAAALVGVIGGGRLADNLIRRGWLNGRITVGAVSYVLAAALLLPALLGRSLTFSMPFYVLASIAFAARNPALDAARLDVMHHRLWGRAEAVRTLLRRVIVATSPVVFGWLADQLSPGHPPGSQQHGFGASADAAGLHGAFLVLLLTLAVSGLMTFLALRTYPRDVATAAASEDATSRARPRRREVVSARTRHSQRAARRVGRG